MAKTKYLSNNYSKLRVAMLILQQHHHVNKIISHWVFKRSFTHSSSLLHNLLRSWKASNEPVRLSYRLCVTFARALGSCDVSSDPSYAECVGGSRGLTRDVKFRRRRALKAAGKGRPGPRDPGGAAAHLSSPSPRQRAAAPRLPSHQSARAS